MRKIWDDHSLTIVSGVLGLFLIIVAAFLKEGTWFDIVVGLGHGAFTAALLFVLSGWLRERNKPEE